MGQKEHPLDYEFSGKAAAGTNDVSGPQTPSGRIVCVQRCGVENETSGAADVRVYKAGIGAEVLVAEEDAVQAATLYWFSEPIYLHEGQHLLARFTACTAGDILKVYLTGWYTESRELEDD